MTHYYQVTVHDRQRGRTYRAQVPDDQYVLMALEAQGIVLPFACRNGCCTTCGVRVLSGELAQPEALGLSAAVRAQGYGLLCVGYARSDLELATQDEDELYELQFGRYFGKGRVRRGLPLEGD
ncbi:MAG: 2Fe-2S iron-sulfur cluster-binding protein [Gloeomargarita sp. SKYBB_i_bin120]|nr:2Fe-2S iron-sulfur cluster-binding protein [Gloeomargarita sp. SKYG98]MCS7293326.1 2Fe-2S iron-sulfur cluster-binding protein [Gloeomargarita sp. SKYB120]MDW8178891.1 2Fe-2S iron-sulfur cluster-binding protein [Gloeomargarita sp. SKYBB_i_bin120]